MSRKVFELALPIFAFQLLRAEKQKKTLKNHQTKAKIDNLQNVTQAKAITSLKRLFCAIGDAPGDIAANIVASAAQKNAQYDDSLVKTIATILAALPFAAITEACGSRTKEYFDNFSAKPIRNSLKMAIYAFGTVMGAFCTSAVGFSLVMHLRKKLSKHE